MKKRQVAYLEMDFKLTGELVDVVMKPKDSNTEEVCFGDVHVFDVVREEDGEYYTCMDTEDGLVRAPLQDFYSALLEAYSELGFPA